MCPFDSFFVFCCCFKKKIEIKSEGRAQNAGLRRLTTFVVMTSAIGWVELVHFVVTNVLLDVLVSDLQDLIVLFWQTRCLEWILLTVLLITVGHKPRKIGDYGDTDPSSAYEKEYEISMPLSSTTGVGDDDDSDIVRTSSSLPSDTVSTPRRKIGDGDTDGASSSAFKNEYEISMPLSTGVVNDTRNIVIKRTSSLPFVTESTETKECSSDNAKSVQTISITEPMHA